MKIDNIIGLHVYTNTGVRLNVKQFVNSPRVGNDIETVGNQYKSIPCGDQSECINGVCPVK